MIKLSVIKTNPKNPRLIKDDKFKKLCKSLQDFPKMMELRPIIVDDNGVILGGNMRLKALQELGFKEVEDSWIRKASDLTDEEKKEFIVKDNVGFGEWDWDMLANEWDKEELVDWGVLFLGTMSNEINLLTENDIEIPEFEMADKEIRLNIYFDSEKQRQDFVAQKDIHITKKLMNQWICRL